MGYRSPIGLVPAAMPGLAGHRLHRRRDLAGPAGTRSIRPMAALDERSLTRSSRRPDVRDYRAVAAARGIGYVVLLGRAAADAAEERAGSSRGRPIPNCAATARAAQPRQGARRANTGGRYLIVSRRRVVTKRRGGEGDTGTVTARTHLRLSSTSGGRRHGPRVWPFEGDPPTTRRRLAARSQARASSTAYVKYDVTGPAATPRLDPIIIIRQLSERERWHADRSPA